MIKNNADALKYQNLINLMMCIHVQFIRDDSKLVAPTMEFSEKPDWYPTRRNILPEQTRISLSRPNKKTNSRS